MWCLVLYFSSGALMKSLPNHSLSQFNLIITDLLLSSSDPLSSFAIYLSIYLPYFSLSLSLSLSFDTTPGVWIHSLPAILITCAPVFFLVWLPSTLPTTPSTLLVCHPRPQSHLVLLVYVVNPFEVCWWSCAYCVFLFSFSLSLSFLLIFLYSILNFFLNATLNLCLTFICCAFCTEILSIALSLLIEFVCVHMIIIKV